MSWEFIRGAILEQEGGGEEGEEREEREECDGSEEARRAKAGRSA
jgi:hypothetical protein